jgi:hypothetical protein
MEDIMIKYNEYDLESLGQEEIDRLLALHNVNDIKIEIMHTVEEDELGEYYIKDGERINLDASEPTSPQAIALDSDF